MEEALKKEELQEIISDFVFESKELIENAINATLKIENNPDEELINGIFRSIHTLKGTSSFLGFERLSNLAHKTEDLLGKLKKKEIFPGPEIVNCLLEAMDHIKGMIELVAEKGNDDRDVDEIIEKIEIAISQKDEPKKKLGEILIEEGVLTPEELTFMLEKQKREPQKRLGEIILEENLATEKQLTEFLTRQKKGEEKYVRIDVKKLDQLMDLVGELTLGKNRLIALREKFSKNEQIESLSEAVSYIESITNELQISVMKARLVPLSKIFNKIPRMVRDLAKEFEKEIELKIEGEETELDRSLVEALENPLVHIIRNSVDHGIEEPEERERKGKRRKGLISVRAYNEGSHVIIEIIDDGKGIDIEAVKRKVKERGLLSEKEIEALSDKEALDLIFIPGLSTAKTTTSVSGRGVGMDVVKTNIEKMNGNIEVQSEKDKGTRIVIRLPLTLAIMRALIIVIKGEIFAIPLHSILEIVKLGENDVKEVDKKEVLLLREKIIPLFDPSVPFFGQRSDKKGYGIICYTGEKEIGIKVDNILGQEEVVIKSLGGFFKGIEGISGATIRGDGRVILILDINGLLGLHKVRKIGSKGMEEFTSGYLSNISPN